MNLIDFGGPIPNLDDIGIPITAEIKDDVPELIAGLVPMKGQVFICGETNSGKTLLALEIISSLTNGHALWGELKSTKKIKRVLYVLSEHYAEVVMRLAQHTRLPFTDQVIILSPEILGWDKWLVSGGRVNIQSIHKYEKWLKNIDLVVWDPLGGFSAGVDVENDNSQMRLVVQTMNDLAHNAGASCIILSHTGKPIMGKDGQEQTRKSYAIRGASSIEDAATNIFYLSKASGESAAAQQAADGQIYALTCRKYKGIAPAEYRLLRDPAKLTHTLLGNRPFIEVKRIATQAKLGALLARVEGMDKAQAIKILAALSNCDERTIRRDLGLP